MNITDSAKTVFLAAMEKTGLPVCHLGLTTTHCGHKGLDLNLIKEEEATRLIEVNGLKVDISEEDEAALDGYTFDGVGNSLRLIAPETAGRGCGCGGNCEEGECCEGCGEGCCGECD